MNGKYNTKSPAVKRLMREAQELSEPTDQYYAQPLDDNLFEWHFTVRGPADSDFQNGLYHGRIILPVDYPMKPPSIIWLTPNGRFETNKKICLSISGHHPESWQPSWSIRTALLAIIGFMPTHPGGAIGSLDYTPEERKQLAKKSKDWKCSSCGDINGILLEVSENSGGTSQESKDLAAQISLQGEKPKCKDGECPIEQARQAEMQSQTADGAGPNLQPPASSANTSQPLPSAGQSSTSSTSNIVTTNTSTNSNIISTANGSIEQPVGMSSPTGLPPMTSNVFPPFSPGLPGPIPFSMSPMGFPFQFLPMPPPPMHFPYPPSHYANMQIPSWPIGPGGVMPPNTMGPPLPFPPPPPPQSSFHPTTDQTRNNNSSQENNQGASNKRKSHSSNTHSRVPVPNRMRQNSSTKNDSKDSSVVSKESSDLRQTVANDEHTDFLQELLTKVQRVGSESVCDQTTDWSKSDGQMENAGLDGLGSEEPANRSFGATGNSDKINLSEHGTESHTSKSQKKTTNPSVSEMGDTNTEDNSESGVPPIGAFETEFRSPLEKNACSSTSELEKMKQKSSTSKTVRQRQSATSSVTQEVVESAAEQERSEASTTRQRIEAESGDTALRNQRRQERSRPGVVQAGFMPANAIRLNRGHDFSLYLMIGLMAASILILLNRLSLMIEW